jgi:hypothetical protein
MTETTLRKLRKRIVDGASGESWLVEVDDATEDVLLDRTVKDILTARRGVASHCMNANCIVRSAERFPHKVYLASVIKTSALLVDELTEDGEPAHAVRYVLTEAASREIQRHDAEGVAQPGDLWLRVPRGNKRLGSKHGASPRSEGHATGERTHKATMGHKGRLAVAAAAGV